MSLARIASGIFRDGQYLNTLYLNTVFKYISCIYTCISNTYG